MNLPPSSVKLCGPLPRERHPESAHGSGKEPHFQAIERDGRGQLRSCRDDHHVIVGRGNQITI